MNKKDLKDLIELVPEVPPELDEIEAFEKAKLDREQNGTIPHEMIDWE